MSGFLLWQSAYSEMWFTDAYWPEFRRVDFLRALRGTPRETGGLGSSQRRPIRSSISSIDHGASSA